MARPRKPTAVKIAEGNRGRRKLNPDAEPQPTPGGTKSPIGLTQWGKTLWRTVTDELDRLNLLTLVDHGALQAAIVGADQANVADRRINGLLRKINSGKAEQHDYYQLSIMNSASKKGWQQFKSFATEFGLTPASRSRLTVEPDGASTPAPKSRKMDPVEEALCAGSELVQ
jgi:P27 family predicted phage terminase small subunit